MHQDVRLICDSKLTVGMNVSMSVSLSITAVHYESWDKLNILHFFSQKVKYSFGK